MKRTQYSYVPNSCQNFSNIETLCFRNNSLQPLSAGEALLKFFFPIKNFVSDKTHKICWVRAKPCPNFLNYINFCFITFHYNKCWVQVTPRKFCIYDIFFLSHFPGVSNHLHTLCIYLAFYILPNKTFYTAFLFFSLTYFPFIFQEHPPSNHSLVSRRLSATSSIDRVDTIATTHSTSRNTYFSCFIIHWFSSKIPTTN